MAHILGRDIIIATVYNETVTPIAGARSCDIDTECEMKPVSSPASGEYMNYKPGRKTWTVLVNMLYTTSGRPVLGTKNIGTRYYLKCYTRNNSVVDKIEGYAYLQRAKVTGTEGNLSQGSWFFQGDGAI